MTQPKEKGTDDPTGAVTPEEVQFQMDLQTAIERSLEDSYLNNNQSAADTSESTKSDNQQTPATVDNNETLTASPEDESEENADDEKTESAVEDQPSEQHEARALEQQDDNEEESSSADSGRKYYPARISPKTEQNCQRSPSQTEDVAGSTRKTTKDPPRNPVVRREIDPDAPRCPVGKGAVKKMFRRPLGASVTASSPSEPKRADGQKRGRWNLGADVPIGVWQYPLPKRVVSPDEFTVKQETPPDEARDYSEKEITSETETSEDDSEVVSRNDLMPQQQYGFDGNMIGMWSNPYSICADYTAYLQRQKTLSEEKEKTEPHVRNIFQEIRSWELREYMEAAKRPPPRRYNQPEDTRVNRQPNSKNDDQQPPAKRENNEPSNGRYNRQQPSTRDSNRPMVSKVVQITGQQKKIIVNTEHPEKTTVNERHGMDTQGPQRYTPPVVVRYTRPVVVSAVPKKEQQAPPSNVKQMITVDEQNQSTELLLRDIVRVFFEKKWPFQASVYRPDSNVQLKRLEPQTDRGRRRPFYSIGRNCNRSRGSYIPVRITGNQITSKGKPNVEQTIPDDELQIREITKKLLEDIKELDLNDTSKCHTQEGPVRTHQEQSVGNVEKQKPSDDKMVSEEQTLISPSVTDSVDLENEFKLRQICVDEKELSEKQAEATGKISSLRYSKIKYIRRHSKSMDKRQFMVVSTTYRAQSDACLPSSTANQQHHIADDETRSSSAATNIKSEIQSHEETVSNEKYTEEMQASQYLHGQKIQEKPQQSIATEKELAEKPQSQQIIAENVTDQTAATLQNTDITEGQYQKLRPTANQNQLVSAEKINYQNALLTDEQTNLKGKNDKALNTHTELGYVSITPHEVNSTMTPEEAYALLLEDSHYEQSVANQSLDRPDFLRLVPSFHQNGGTLRPNFVVDKEGGEATGNVPPKGTDIEDDSSLDELTDSFDIVKQDISVIREDILRRAQRYGYVRHHRRRMASALRHKKAHTSAYKQRSSQTDYRKEATQQKTTSLRRVPSMSWKGQLHSSAMYDRIRNQEAGDKRSSKTADGSSQVAEPSVSARQTFVRSVPAKQPRFVCCCSRRVNTDVINDQRPLPPQILDPPDLIQHKDIDKEKQDVEKENEVSDQQPVVPVANGISNGEDSNGEPLKELDNVVEDEIGPEIDYEVPQEQSNIIQAAIKNYLRTFGIPVHRVISVLFVEGDPLAPDENSANGEHAIGEQLSNEDSSEQKDNPSPTDDGAPHSDEETDEDPEEDLDR